MKTEVGLGADAIGVPQGCKMSAVLNAPKMCLPVPAACLPPLSCLIHRPMHATGNLSEAHPKLNPEPYPGCRGVVAIPPNILPGCGTQPPGLIFDTERSRVLLAPTTSGPSAGVAVAGAAACRQEAAGERGRPLAGY